ncbi:hypothetical protein Gpo141_00008463 [Globisporangium polare]
MLQRELWSCDTLLAVPSRPYSLRQLNAVDHAPHAMVSGNRVLFVCVMTLVPSALLIFLLFVNPVPLQDPGLAVQ